MKEALTIGELERALGAKVDTSLIDRKTNGAAPAAAPAVPFQVTAEFLRGQIESLNNDRAGALATVNQIDGAIQLCEAMLKLVDGAESKKELDS